MLAQLRLAWWRDRFAADPATWPQGEPLLGHLAGWDGVSALGALVDGWEALLGDPPLGEGAFNEFANGRAKAIGVLAARHEAPVDASEMAGRRWALADLALHVGDPQERAAARALLADSAAPGRTSRSMRPLALLAGLTERAVRRGHGEALNGVGALFAAIRLGITGC
jgi:phytoene synthase